MTKTNPRPAPAASHTTVRATTAQAIVRYLAAQTSVRDGRRQRLIPAMLGIFGHGNVAGMGQALDEYQSRAAVHPGPQRAVARPHRGRIRQGQSPHRGARRDRLDRPRRGQHGHRRRAGHDQSPARAAARRRHVRDAPPGSGAAAARARHGGRPERQRLLPARGALLRPDHASRAAADRAARGDARPHQPGRGGRGRDRVAAGRSDRGLRLPGRVLRRRASGRSTVPRPIRTRWRPSPS